MTVAVDVVQLAANTVAGTQDFTISGFGTPKAYLLFATQATVNGTAANHAVIGFGGGDGVRQFAGTARARDDVTMTQVHRHGTTSHSLEVMAAESNAIHAQASFDSFIPDGFRLNWSMPPSTAILVHAMLFGGSSLTAYVGAGERHTGAQDAEQLFTDAAFSPDCVFVTSIGRLFNDTVAVQAPISFGFSANSSPIRQFCSAFNDVSDLTVSRSFAFASSSRVSAQLATSQGVTTAVEVTSYSASGFGLTKRDSGSNFDFSYLALNFGGQALADVRTFTSPAAAGALARAEFGWNPQVVMLLPTFLPSLDMVENNEANGAGVFACSLLTGLNQYSLGISSLDLLSNDSDTQSLVDDQAALVARGDGSVALDASQAGFDASGYSLNFATTDATPRQWGEWGIQSTTPVHFRNLAPVSAPLVVPPVTLVNVFPEGALIFDYLEVSGVAVDDKANPT